MYQGSLVTVIANETLEFGVAQAYGTWTLFTFPSQLKDYKYYSNADLIRLYWQKDAIRYVFFEFYDCIHLRAFRFVFFPRFFSFFSEKKTGKNFLFTFLTHFYIESLGKSNKKLY